MENIIIYGLGKDYFEEKSLIEKKYNVIAYTDKKKYVCNIRYIPFEQLLKEKYDYILITSQRYFCEMYTELLNLGVDRDKVIGTNTNLRWNAIQEIKEYLNNRGEKTSISEESYYPLVCKAAVDKQLVFNNFRSNPIYTDVLEHVTYEQGKEYLNIIEKTGGERVCFDMDQWREYLKNDSFGKPQVYTYAIRDTEINISPTTLRYIKVLSDLYELYNVNSIKKIIEIGVGYGGQCRIIINTFKELESYILIDLKEVLYLSEKYLSGFQEMSNVSYVVGDAKMKEYSCDLVISNYAFSELRREIQDIYLEKVILNSKAGYITWNNLGEHRYNSYSVNELLEKIPNAEVIDEEPLTNEGNCIIYWSNI